MSFSSGVEPRFHTQGKTSPFLGMINFNTSSCHQRIQTIPRNPLCESFPCGSKGLQSICLAGASVPSSQLPTFLLDLAIWTAWTAGKEQDCVVEDPVLEGFLRMFIMYYGVIVFLRCSKGVIHRLRDSWDVD